METGAAAPVTTDVVTGGNTDEDVTGAGIDDGGDGTILVVVVDDKAFSVNSGHLSP